MKYFGIVATFILWSLQIKASPQLPDYIIYKKDTIPIYHLILEEYFHSIKTKDKGSLFGLSFRENASTNCWRGYQAVYILENDSLFLKNILTCGEFHQKEYPINLEASDSKMKDIFKEKLIKNKVYVNWYSGRIGFARGRLLRWDGVFSRTYHKEEILDFKKGVLKKSNIVDNYIDLPDGISRDLPNGKFDFNYKAITDTFFSIIKKLNWKKLSACECDDRYILVINERGKIKNIRLFSYLDEKENLEYEKHFRKCISMFKRKLKVLKFDIIKWNGNPYKERIVFEVFYTDDGKIENWTH